MILVFHRACTIPIRSGEPGKRGGDGSVLLEFCSERVLVVVLTIVCFCFAGAFESGHVGKLLLWWNVVVAMLVFGVLVGC